MGGKANWTDSHYRFDADRELITARLDNGDSTVHALAREYGIPRPTAHTWVTKWGVALDRTTSTRVGKSSDRTRRVDADSLVIISRYLSGVSENVIAHDYGVSRNVIATRLRRWNVARRSITEANRLEQASRTPEQRRANAAAAHDAARGSTHSVEHRSKIALVRQDTLVPTAAEQSVIDMLAALRPVAQRAIGPYNVDIGIAPIAVEINVGHWHGSGRHADRVARRSEHILDAGWHLVLVWITDVLPLTTGCGDYLIAFHKKARRNPSAQREYRVIGGGGEDCTARYPNLESLRRPPSRRGGYSNAGSVNDR